jgi:hypothetical protein
MPGRQLLSALFAALPIPGGVWPADPNDPLGQQVLFTYGQGAFTFKPGNATPTPSPGNLYIREQATLPSGQASVGIGMSGSGTVVVPAEPNQDLVFTPHPTFWITAGAFWWTPSSPPRCWPTQRNPTVWKRLPGPRLSARIAREELEIG